MLSRTWVSTATGPCGNKGAWVVDGTEGFVGPHCGILGVGDLDPRMVGWLHPVLEVSVER